MERLDFDLLFRWFVGLGVDGPVWDASTLSKNRDRLLAGDAAAAFLATFLPGSGGLRLRAFSSTSMGGRKPSTDYIRLRAIVNARQEVLTLTMS